MATEFSAASVIETQQLAGAVKTLGSAIGRVITFNKNSKTVQNAPTDPYKVLTAAHADDVNVKLVAAPANASYLTLMHEFTGSVPGVIPTVRVFGKLPLGNSGTAEYAPGAVGGTFGAPIDSLGQWVPLGNMNTGVFLLTVGSATDTTAETINATSLRGIPVSVHLRGCTHVLVCIVTAATTVTLGQIVGTFEV